MLEVRHVSKIYFSKRFETPALNDVSFVLPSRGLVFILGKSASGKSTLLNILSGLDSPTSGDVLYQGRAFSGFKDKDFDAYRNEEVGFVFQSYNLISNLSVYDNLALALKLQGKPVDKSSIASLLKELDLEGIEKRYPAELSGGQKQRVAIARALIKKPKILFADEPTGALDTKTGETILEILKKASEKMLVVVVSHDESFAEKYAERILTLADGKIVSDVTKKERPEDKEESGSISRPGHLPFFEALALGWKSLKAKPIRLVMTILLAACGYALFAFSDTCASAPGNQRLNEALAESNFSAFSLRPEIYCEGGEDEGHPEAALSSSEDALALSKATGLPFRGCVQAHDYGDYAYSLSSSTSKGVSDLCPPLNWFCEAKEEDQAYLLAGSLPTKMNDVALSDYAVWLFNTTGFKYRDDAWEEHRIPAGEVTPESLIGKTLFRLNFVVSGIFSTHFDAKYYLVEDSQSLYGYRSIKRPNDDLNGYVNCSFGGIGLLSSTGMKWFCTHEFAYSPFDGPLKLGENGVISDVEEDSSVRLMNDSDCYFFFDPSRTSLGKGEYLSDFASLDPLLVAPGKAFPIEDSDTPSSFPNFEKKVPNGLRELRNYLKEIAVIRCGEKDGDAFAKEPCYPKILSLCDTSLSDEKTKKAQALVYYLQDKIKNDFRDDGDPYIADCSSLLTPLCAKYFRRYKSDLFAQDVDKIDSSHPYRIHYLDGTSKELPRRRAGLSVSASTYNVNFVNEETFSFLFDGRGTDYRYGLLCCHSVSDKKAIQSVLSMQEKQKTAVVGCQKAYRFVHPVVLESESLDLYLSNMQIYCNVFGSILCLFSALLMGNFVALSIERRKKDIGILRCLGARGIDVFLIYSLEGILISLFAYLLAIPANFILSYFGNASLKKGLSVSLDILFPGIRQVLLLLFFAILVALIASYFPIRHFVKKKPCEILERE